MKRDKHVTWTRIGSDVNYRAPEAIPQPQAQRLVGRTEGLTVFDCT